MAERSPLDDFRDLLRDLPTGDPEAEKRVRANLARMSKPEGSLGRLEDIAAWLARWSGRMPSINRAEVAIFAGNHGVARHGVSPRSVIATQAAVELCAAGGAAVNQLCVAYDLGLKVFDLALDLPTADITEAAALDERGCAATMAFGLEAATERVDLLALGDLGVGNSTVGAAVCAALFGGSGSDWAGPGSGASEPMIRRKAEIVDRALAFHAGHLGEPLEVLRRLGGRELAGIAGAILSARAQSVPVILDGYATLAAAAVLHVANPKALDHCLVAHAPLGAGGSRLVRELGLQPLVDIGLHHGEGAGAALAAGIVKAAALTYSGMAVALASQNS